MAVKILSDVVLIDKPEILSSKMIETYLSSKYGELIRWAIIAVEYDNYKDKTPKLKICLTYEKGT